MGSTMKINTAIRLALPIALLASGMLASLGCGDEPPKRPRKVVQFQSAPGQPANAGNSAPGAAPVPRVATGDHKPVDVEASFAPAVNIYTSQLEQIIGQQNRQSARIIQVNGQPVPKLDPAAPGRDRTGSIHFTASLTQPNEKEASLLYDVTVLFVFRSERWDYDRPIIDTRFLKPNDLDALTARKFTEQMQALLSSNLLMAGVALEKQLELQRSLE
jgi:hypothetical protein